MISRSFNTYNPHQKEFSQDEIREILHQKLREQNYDSVEKEDRYLAGIKQVCFSFIYDNELPDVQESEIQNALNFLGAKYNYLKRMEKSLTLKHYSWPLTEFSQSVDEYILSENKESFVHEHINGKLSKDLTTAVEQISFSYGIMKKVQENMKESKNDN